MTEARCPFRICNMAEEGGGQSKKSSSTLERLVPVLLVLSIGLAFAVGMLWQKVSSIEKDEPQVAGVAKPQDDTGGHIEPTQGLLNESQAAKIPEITDRDHVRGSRDAQVFIIEYSDYECPFCKNFHLTAKEAVDVNNGKVAWVYRHYPLDALHPKARTESIAAECAYKQGGDDAFWAMSDLIYESDSLNIEDLPKLAEQVGLDSEVLQTCIDNKEFEDYVEQQFQGGTTAGITSYTPASFVVAEDGRIWLLRGAVSAESLQTVIDEALQG